MEDVVVFEGVVVDPQIEINVGHDIESSEGIKVWGKAASISQTIVSGGGWRELKEVDRRDCVSRVSQSLCAFRQAPGDNEMETKGYCDTLHLTHIDD